MPAGRHEAIAQGLALEVDRDESQLRWDGNPGVRQSSAFPSLCRGVVRFEDAQAERDVGIAVGKRIETGAEEHVLPNTGRDYLGEGIFRETVRRGARRVLPHMVRVARRADGTTVRRRARVPVRVLP